MFKILICGGRGFEDADYLFLSMDKYIRELQEESPIAVQSFNQDQMYRLRDGEFEIITGGAKGADTLAKLWADSRGYDCVTFWANWNKFKKSAGPIRNKRMLRYNPDVVVAYPGDKGTQNMLQLARTKGIWTEEHVISHGFGRLVS